MDKDSKVYVAGHRGLVGSALMRSLQSKGYRHIITRTHAELDLTDQVAVRDFFQAERPEYVFLAAAKVGGILANNTYPAEFIRENLAIQANVIHEAWRSGVKRLLFLGSSCIYPRDCPQPIKEEYLLTGPLEMTNRPYAIAKIAGIEMCWSYNRQYGTRFLAVMPTNLYGVGDNYDLQYSHVLPAIIRKIHLAKLASLGDMDGIARDENAYGPIPVDVKESLFSLPLRTTVDASRYPFAENSPAVRLWGTGAPRREFIYSDDMADACLFLMDMSEQKYASLFTSEEPPLVNIGCGEDLTIKELAECVADIVGFEGRVIWDKSRPDGTPRKLLDVTRLGNLGWRPSISLREGVARAYKDFLSKYGT